MRDTGSIKTNKTQVKNQTSLNPKIRKNHLYPAKLVSNINQLYIDSLNTWVLENDGSDLLQKIKVKKEILSIIRNKEITYICLKNLNLKTIPPLFGLKEIKYIDLSENQISEIHPTTFFENTKLRSINFRDNNIRELDSEIFSQNPSIENLDFGKNQLKNLNNRTLSYLPNLKQLNLCKNDISEIHPLTFKENLDLSNLYLSQNKLTSFSSNYFSCLISIKLVDLENNQINDFDWPLTNNGHCHIKLRSNPLPLKISTPYYYAQFSSSYSGSIFDMPIQTNISGMIHSTSSNNEELPVKNKLFYDYIQEVMDWINKEDESSRHCKISALEIIANFISYSPFIKDILDLSYENIHSIPPLYALKKMKRLILSNNNIRSLKKTALPTTGSLVSIDLSRNKLSTLDENSFPKENVIESLVLDRNNFTHLEGTFLSTVPHLKSIYLNFNQIQTVNTDTFENTPNMEFIELQNNHIPFLYPQTVLHLKNLRKLNLESNCLIEFLLTNSTQTDLTVNLERNNMSTHTIACINDMQNNPSYRGPLYILPPQAPQSPPTVELSIHFVRKTFQNCKYEDLDQKWENKIKTLKENEKFIFQTVIQFLFRLQNEIPRNESREIPSIMQNYLHEFLNTIAKYDFNPDLTETCFQMTRNALGECIDRIGIYLIMMTLHARQFDCKQKNQLAKADQYSKQLYDIQRIIKFIDDLDNYKIIYEEESQTFFELNHFYGRSIIIPNLSICATPNEVSKRERLQLIKDLRKQGVSITQFDIHDQIEDILIIVNALKSNGLSDIEPIEIRFGTIATMTNYLPQIINYLKVT